MNLAEQGLSRHLAWLVVIKVLVLTALWWAFVRDQRVAVDAEVAARAITAAAPIHSAASAAAQPKDTRP